MVLPISLIASSLPGGMQTLSGGGITTRKDTSSLSSTTSHVYSLRPSWSYRGGEGRATAGAPWLLVALSEETRLTFCNRASSWRNSATVLRSWSWKIFTSWEGGDALLLSSCKDWSHSHSSLMGGAAHSRYSGTIHKRTLWTRGTSLMRTLFAVLVT